MTFPFKMGCLPAQFPGELRDLTFYVAGSLPKPPPSVAVPVVSAWEMLGNDQYGDCGVASLEHGFMADATVTKEVETEASDQQAIDYYLKYTDGQDSGVVLSQYLAYVRTNGYYERSITAYAPVAVHDVPTLQTAISLYDFVYTGISVTADMQTAFQNGQPWTTEQLVDSPVVGGHAVPLCGYDDSYLYAITWGGVQPITYSM